MSKRGRSLLEDPNSGVFLEDMEVEYLTHTTKRTRYMEDENSNSRDNKNISKAIKQNSNIFEEKRWQQSQDSISKLTSNWGFQFEYKKEDSIPYPPMHKDIVLFKNVRNQVMEEQGYPKITLESQSYEYSTLNTGPIESNMIQDPTFNTTGLNSNEHKPRQHSRQILKPKSRLKNDPFLENSQCSGSPNIMKMREDSSHVSELKLSNHINDSQNSANNHHNIMIPVDASLPVKSISHRQLHNTAPQVNMDIMSLHFHKIINIFGMESTVDENVRDLAIRILQCLVKDETVLGASMNNDIKVNNKKRFKF